MDIGLVLDVREKKKGGKKKMKYLDLQEVITTCENMFYRYAKKESIVWKLNHILDDGVIILDLEKDFIKYQNNQEFRLRQCKDAIMAKLRSKFNNFQDFDSVFIRNVEQDVDFILKIMDKDLTVEINNQIKNIFGIIDLKEGTQ